MTKEYIDTLLSQLKKKLANHSPPHVRYDKNDKRISVTYDFNHGFIQKVKIIAPREKWLEFLDQLEQLKFNDIESYFSKHLSKKTQSELKTYFDKWPDDFLNDVLTCIKYANAHNPLYPPATKARGGSPHRLTWHEINKIKAAAREIYIYLEHNRDKLDRFNDPESQTMGAIDNLFPGFDIGKIDDPKTFYNKYISHRPLKILKNSERIKKGNTPILKTFLKHLK